MLKQAYFRALEADWDIDDDGQIFAYILSRDSNFILEYIDWIYQAKDESYRFSNTRDYSFIWRCDSCEQMMSQLIEYVYKKNHKKYEIPYLELSKFFILKANETDSDILCGRQDRCLMKFVESHCNCIKFIQFLFNVVATFSPTRRRSFIALFIKQNKSYEDFKNLPLEPFWSCSGSKVPVYQKRIEYFETLIPLLNSVELLKHKLYIEQTIQFLREEMETEKKEDFMND